MRGGEMQELPSRTELDSVVSLLADDKRTIVDACRSRILEWGERARAALERAASNDSPELRVAARRVLRSLDLRIWADQVSDLGGRAGLGRSCTALLEEGIALIHSLGCPVDEHGGFAQRIERLVEGARRVVAGRSAVTAARNLAAYLGGAHGYTGCTKSYYRPENLLLGKVVERRRGLPIALVVLYLVVGRRAGLEVAAVRLPDDYYLVRVHGRRAQLLDPFHRGRSVTKADCLRYLRSVGATKPLSSQLRDVDDVHLLLDMMATLERVYEHREDREFREALRQAQRSLSLL